MRKQPLMISASSFLLRHCGRFESALSSPLCISMAADMASGSDEHQMSRDRDVAPGLGQMNRHCGRTATLAMCRPAPALHYPGVSQPAGLREGWDSPGRRSAQGIGRQRGRECLTSDTSELNERCSPRWYQQDKAMQWGRRVV